MNQTSYRERSPVDSQIQHLLKFDVREHPSGKPRLLNDTISNANFSSLSVTLIVPAYNEDAVLNLLGFEVA